jgi:putative flavoprotein involved in K+ transport
VTREQVDTIVIGGGQAGLAVSYLLGRHGREHIVLERHRIGERWRSERWDSLTFQFPNWTLQLPDYSYRGEDADAFSSRDEVVRFIESFAAFGLSPVRCGVNVTALRPKPGSARFQVETDHGMIEAANVVIATGPYQKPAIPQRIAGAMPRLFQVHSSHYRNPELLPPGAVLVVGSGASGCQIAEDIQRSGGRVVYLATGAHRRVPRRYRGRDFAFWGFAVGEFDRTLDQRPAERSAPLLTGVNGGHDMDLRRLARDGAVLLGRLSSAEDGRLALASDLGATLARGDAWFAQFVETADDYAERNGLDLPEEDFPANCPPEPKEAFAPIRELDLKAAGISSVIWATGYGYDFDWVRLPVFSGATGEPIHRRGVATVPGLYFIGLQWLSKRKSSLMAGVGEDAAFIADHIAAR